MKKIFTLFTVLVCIALVSEINVAATTISGGTQKPVVSPNPAHDFIKVNWEQSQCDNVNVTMYYPNGTIAKMLCNREFCDGIYSQMFKVSSLPRGSYLLRVQIGSLKWSYKILLQ